MPNYVTHRVSVSGEGIQKFYDECFTDGTIDFNKIIPQPKVLENTVSGSPSLMTNENNFRALEETGFPNWYDWSLENWGTKWNVCDGSVISKIDDELIFTFETAWSVPHPIFEKIAELYPGLSMEISAFDEGWNFAIEASILDNEYTFEEVETTDEMYEQVHGEKPEYEEDED